MGSSNDDSTRRRTLRLDRETIRDLAPSESDAAAVRGGDDPSYLGTSNPRCEAPNYDAVRALLGQTSLTLGMTGSVTIMPRDGGHEISFDLRPQPELLELQAKLLGRQDVFKKGEDFGRRDG